MSELTGVWIYCASEEGPTRIAEEAVNRRLAACSNIHAPIVSPYHSKGRVENNREVPLLLKTRPSLLGHLSRLIEETHSYEKPSIIGIAAGHWANNPFACNTRSSQVQLGERNRSKRSDLRAQYIDVWETMLAQSCLIGHRRFCFR